MHRDSFSEKSKRMKRKINVVTPLVHRAMFICSSSRLPADFTKIRPILVANGYPNIIIIFTFSKKIRQFNQSSQHGPKKYPVYFIFHGWEMFQPNLKIKFLQPFSVATLLLKHVLLLYVVFTTRSLLPATKKDVIPAHHHNNVIYQFVCHCNSRYVGRHPKGCKNA